MEKMITDNDEPERMMMRSPPSSEGKMVIKLKIPKLAAAAMEGEKTPEKDVIGILSTSSSGKMVIGEGRKTCLECNKSFSSGKALGGHMRVHVQSANKNPSFLKPPKTIKKTAYHDYTNEGDGDGDANLKLIHTKKQSKPYYMNSVNNEGKPTCSQCGKTFPSMKSLFGHMRCHPERDWRGILPPPHTPTAAARRRTLTGTKIPNSSGSGSSSEEDGGDQVVDLTKYLRGWSVTERRGRRSLKPAVDEEEDDDVLLEAVEDLMSLANGVVSVAESVVTERELKVEVTEGSNSNCLMNKGKAVTEEVKLPAKLELDDGDVKLMMGLQRNDDVINSSYNSYNNNRIKKRKKMKLMMELQPNDGITSLLLEQQQEAECKYKCNTCNKCFTSHQALGGHRSSHNKPKFIPMERHPIEESFVMNLFGENSEKEVAFSGVGVHQCKICDKIFATGQALGGHQRCHWTGTNIVQAPSSQITSAGEAASQTGGDRKVLDFDLNEIPLAMMEEDEGGNGNGYASSSYNSNIC